ncbi:hypothetical protein Godav_005389 [Gossypium davidsonii]|uniref:RNase H type-1 domain-containing protein n=2 Tax=Gossypium TaxID=3633 RepID=A0A7J8T6P7_GOSDV|nr:hypothetical protein [Gossypium davidsonii]MBA0669266.1 hypothetical protein [Gossypium klotzschianum]
MDLMLKLNFDTTFHGQSHQSYSGFVVRNAQGQVLGTRMVRNNFVSDPFVGEVLACLDGLHFATDMDLLIGMRIGWPHILAKARSTFREVHFWVEDVPDIAVLAMKAECSILVALD